MRIACVVLLMSCLGLLACGPDETVEAVDGADPAALLAPHVEPGDILVSINGRAVTSREEALDLVKSVAEAAASWEIVVDRRGELVTLQIEPPR